MMTSLSRPSGGAQILGWTAEAWAACKPSGGGRWGGEACPPPSHLILSLMARWEQVPRDCGPSPGLSSWARSELGWLSQLSCRGVGDWGWGQ